MSVEPPPVNLYELFPELSQDVDRRIAHAETRIKYWVVAGVLVNLVSLVIAAIPLVYYLGGVQAQTGSVAQTVQSTSTELQRRGDWMQDRELWEQSMESWAQQKGYIPPRDTRRFRGSN